MKDKLAATVPDVPGLADCFTPERLAARLGEAGSWRPYPAAADRTAWNAINPAARDQVLGQAARMLAEPWPVLTAGAYRRFFEDGDRQSFERPYFTRRSRLGASVLTAALAGPSPERVSEIVDGVWLLCEETSWCVPAHDLFVRKAGTRLPDPTRPCVDLFAAETAALLAYADLLVGDLLEPVVRARLRDQVRARVLDPYRNNDHWWWLGLGQNDLNNWTPWIHSNLLAASLLLDDERPDILALFSRAVGALDRYLDAVPDDGGCDEGIGYWWRAGGSLLECLEILSSACGDDFGVFQSRKIAAIARYPLVAHICGEWHVNFADGLPKPGTAESHVLYRFGTRVGDQEVAAHARALRGPHGGPASSLTAIHGSIARPLAEIFDEPWAASPLREFPLPAQAWLPATGVLTARQRGGSSQGLFLAAKAGNNGESHNHNDVGTFIIAADGRPLLIDVGVGVYTRQTFGPDRYEIWTMQSSWHSVPEVDGFAQAPGREYAARRVQGLLSASGAELSMDLAGAYPAAAGIRSWRRVIRLDRSGTGAAKILLDDAWDIDHTPERIVVHLISAHEPSARAAGRLALSADDGFDLAIDYSQDDFDAKIEERAVDDPRLARNWGRQIYRIALVAKRPASQGALRLEVSAVPPVS